MSPTLSIIIVSYNTRELTLACIRSVFAQTRVPFELLIIDNASDDGSADAIELELAGRVDFVRSAVNHGFARANNLLAGRATGEFILLLNPDTVVLNGAIDRLVEFARLRPHAGIWGGRTVFADGVLNPTSCWRRQSCWSLLCHATGLSSIFRRSSVFNPEGMGGWQRDSERQVDIVTGCFFLVRRTLWERLGGFDPAFFMYGEEADLCLRAARLGARPMLTPGATIVHYGGASEKVRTEKMVRLLRAKSMLIRRHWPSVLAPVGVWLLAAGCFTRGLALRGRPAAAAWMDIWNRRRDWMGGFGVGLA